MNSIALKTLTGLVLMLVSAMSAVANEALPVRGSTTVRAAWFFKVCEIRLYAEAETSATQVLDGRPLALEIEYARSISADTLVNYGNEGLNAAHPESLIQHFQSQIERINEAYVDVQEGDVYRLDFDPATGLELSLNGESVIEFTHPEFGKFYLGIWLGSHSRAESIKDGLFE